MPAGDMDSEYSVGTNNRFIGIDDDGENDPFELIRAAQEKPSKKEKEVKGKGKKEAKKGKEAETVTFAETNEKKESSRGGRGGRGGRGRGGRSPNVENKGFGDNQRNGGGSRGACRRCNEEGHFVKDCPQAPPPREPRNMACHKCHEEGHFARECPNVESAPRSGACHKCGEEGHFARQCSNSQGGGSGGFRAPSSDGFGAPSSGGFGAPSSGGFGAPSEGFGAPSEGFGAPATEGGFGSPSEGGFGAPDEQRGGKSGYRGSRGGRGRGRGGRGREFDRRSGNGKTSVKPTEKRDGSGSYNWGTPGEENTGEETQQGPSDSEPVEGGVESAGEENKENTPSEMSLDEYKKQMEESRSKPQFNIRQVTGKIKGVQLRKPTEEETEKEGDLFFPRKIYEERYKSSGRVKEHVPVDLKYSTGENRHMDGSRRGGRGGRGVNRGNRNGGSSQKNESANIQIASNEEFPSL